MADDIEEFIAQQKSRLARERQELQQQNNEKVYQDLQNGSNGSVDVLDGKKSQDEPASQQNGGGQLVFGQEDVQAKLRRERKLEYEQYLKEKEARSVQKRSVQGGHGKSLPIQDRGSAKARAENQRNQEYKAFMREKELKEKERRDQRRGAYPSPREQPGNSLPYEKPTQSVTENNRSIDITPVKKEAASQTPHPPPEYDDSRPPLPPRKGWGSPQPGPDYDDLLRRRKEEEARYRRYGDLDYYPVRQSLKPSRSDPRLDRYPEEDGRYSRVRDSEDHDRRRVRFTDLEAPGQEKTYYNDRPPYPATDRQDPGYRDQLGVTRSRTLPELERSASKANPRAQSASRLKQEEEGFIIGNRETNSAVQRKKELYRQELAQQIQEQKEAKQRERQEDIRLVSQAGPEPSRSGRRSVASSKTPQPNLQPPPAGQAYTPSFLNQAYNGQPQSRASNQYAINSAVPPLNIPVNDISQQPQRPPPVQEQIGNLGLDEAYAKSRPSNLDQPFSIYNPPTLGQQNPGDPYVYYKLRNPLEPDPNYNLRQMLTFQPTSAVMSPGPLTFNDGVSPGQLRQGQVPPPQYNQIPQASVAFPRGDNSSRNYGQNADLSPRALKDPKSYQAQLMQQMREKELRKRQEKEDKVRYEAKLEADAQNYNPWGKGGAGAPMRNAQGQVFADLKQLHNLNEQALQDPQKPVQLYSNTSQPVPGNPSTTAAPSGIARAIAERGLNPPAEEAVGVSSQVPPPSNQITSPVDSYKEQLRLQVEEKKRREAAEKEKLRLEEEKEERRLAEQQERMKREFEQEQEAKKRKEEEKRKQQADMEAKLEEKRKEAEERKKEAHSIKRVEPTQNEQAYQRQVASPPVPALTKNAKQLSEPDAKPVAAATANSIDRLKSPPVPTLRDKSTDNSPEDGKLRRTPRQEEGKVRRTPIQETTPRNNKDEELPVTARSESPPVPAVSNRERDGGERDVISALSAMRKQLQSEQRRVQSQLEKHRDYDPYVQAKPQVVSRRASPQVDIFEVARHKGSVAVRREPINHQAADDFNNLRNRGGGSQSRQRLREQYPSEPQSNLALEAQQRALLKHQQSRLNNLKLASDSRNKDIYLPNLDDLGRASESPAVPLESSSAFIGIEGGQPKLTSKPISKEIYDFYLKPSPEPAKLVDPFGSTSSFDNATVDRLAQKNQERNEALKALEPDSESLVDADDILNQFLAKQSIDSQMLRPLSGKSEDLSLWLKPSEG